MTSQIIYQINKEDLDDRIRQLSGDQLLKKKDAAELISVSLDTFDRLVKWMDEFWENNPNLPPPATDEENKDI